MIVSFGVYFNGTTLDEIAALVGVQTGSPYEVLSNLVRCADALSRPPCLQVSHALVCVPLGFSTHN